jgi:hypothetical protein
VLSHTTLRFARSMPPRAGAARSTSTLNQSAPVIARAYQPPVLCFDRCQPNPSRSRSSSRCESSRKVKLQSHVQAEWQEVMSGRKLARMPRETPRS